MEINKRNTSVIIRFNTSQEIVVNSGIPVFITILYLVYKHKEIFTILGNQRQGHLNSPVQFMPGRRRGKRRMGMDKTGKKIPRFVSLTVFPDKAGRMFSDPMGGVHFCGNPCRLGNVVHFAADSVSLVGVTESFFTEFLIIGFLIQGKKGHFLHPFPAVESTQAGAVRRKMAFTNTVTEIAGIGEELHKAWAVRGHFVIGKTAGFGWVLSEYHRTPGRDANRRGAIGVGKTDPPLYQTIDIGSFDYPVTQRSDSIKPELIAKNV
jgi:hypothetical protein